jgi:hypothetical protein
MNSESLVDDDKLEQELQESLDRQQEVQSRERKEYVRSLAKKLDKQWHREREALDRLEVFLFLYPDLAEELTSDLRRAWLMRQEDRRRARELLYEVRQLYGESGMSVVGADWVAIELKLAEIWTVAPEVARTPEFQDFRAAADQHWDTMGDEIADLVQAIGEIIGLYGGSTEQSTGQSLDESPSMPSAYDDKPLVEPTEVHPAPEQPKPVDVLQDLIGRGLPLLPDLSSRDELGRRLKQARAWFRDYETAFPLWHPDWQDALEDTRIWLDEREQELDFLREAEHLTQRWKEKQPLEKLVTLAKETEGKLTSFVSAGMRRQVPEDLQMAIRSRLEEEYERTKGRLRANRRRRWALVQIARTLSEDLLPVGGYDDYQ